MKNKQQRKYGIDLLKIIAMYMITCLHVLISGALEQAVFGSAQYYAGQLLYIIALPAVNIYALCSGYLMYQSSCRYSRLLERWIQIAAYSICLYFLLADSYSAKTLFRAATPIISRQYWYTTAYFGMYLLAPLLNRAVAGTNGKNMAVTLLSMFLLFSCLPTAINSDPFVLNYGYSMLWLVLLYILGAAIHKWQDYITIAPPRLIATIVACTGITCIIKFIWAWRYFLQNGEITATKGDWIAQYTSPLILLAGICWFLLIQGIRVKGECAKRWIKRISATTLGVYLIHVNGYVMSKILGSTSAAFLEYNIVVFILSILSSAASIFIICATLDALRERLFQAANVSRICTYLCDLVQKVFYKLWCHFFPSEQEH